MKRFSFKQRFHYWFDNIMAQGTISMIRLLALATLLFVLALALTIALLNVQEEGGFLAALWDGFASTINAWVLYSDDGSPLYIGLMAVAAVVGLLITSVLISILTSGMEEKIAQLRQGSSQVLESGHIVVLGFDPGSYELLRELCAAAPKERRCIVVAGSESKETMENLIRENVDIPPQSRIICREIDISDPVALSCCSIPFCKTVIINVAGDTDAIRVLLAVNAVLRDSPDSSPSVITCIEDDKNVLPAQMAGGRHVMTLPMETIVARLIAHTCTQSGIARTFSEIFSFTGSEFYFESYPQLVGRTFSEALLMAEHMTPVGVLRNGKLLVNPADGTVIEAADSLLILTEDRWDGAILPAPLCLELPPERTAQGKSAGEILVFGCGDALEEIAAEFLGEKRSLRVVVSSSQEQEALPPLENIAVTVADSASVEALEDLVQRAGHIILLSDQSLEPDAADMKSILLLLRLREIRDRRALSFNITAELKQEKNKLLVQDDCEDFIIASDISSMITAQIAESPGLIDLFRELLSNAGNELYLLPAGAVVAPGTTCVHGVLRSILRRRGAIYLGYTKTEQTGRLTVTLNPHLQDEVTPEEGDGIIVIAESRSV